MALNNKLYNVNALAHVFVQASVQSRLLKNIYRQYFSPSELKLEMDRGGGDLYGFVQIFDIH
jgi:hypothetical protein